VARKSRKHQHNAPAEQKTQKQYTAGIYARISSREQKGGSIENQIRIAEQCIQSNPDIRLHKVYTDFGFSSFASYRPGFEELLSDVEAKTINCIIVKDISRFSRDYIEAGDLLERKFPKWGIRFISVGDDFDSLHDDSTKIEVALQSLWYYSYSIDLSKKIQSAIKTRQEIGSYTPARLPYGYVKAQNGCRCVKWCIDEITAQTVRYIFKNALDGLSAYAIASSLNRLNTLAPNSKFWTSSSVLRILRNNSYIGTFVTGKTRNDRSAEFRLTSVPPEEWIRHYDHHAPIIDEITFNSVQRMLSERCSPIPTIKKVADFFGGKLYCGLCGRKMRAKRSANGSTYYICPRRDESASSCTNKSRSETKLKQQVFLDLCETFRKLRAEYQKMLDFEDSPYFQWRKKEQSQLLRTYANDLERQNQLFQMLYEYGVSKHLSHSADFRELMRYLRNVRSALQDKISDIEQSRKEYQEAKSHDNVKFHMCMRVQGYDELTKELIAETIHSVNVYPDGVKINLKLDG